MPVLPTATANYCEHCGASVNPEAKYCQNCGKVISSSDISRGEAATRAKDTDLTARLFALETKIEEIKQLLFRRDSIENDEITHVDQNIKWFPSIYATLITIVQSIALGYLFLAIKDQLGTYLTHGTYNPIWSMLIIAIFLWIVSVFSVGVLTRRALRYVPDERDILIPFLFGLTEALAIFSISFQKFSWYYFSIGLFWLVGFFSFFHMFRESKLLYEKNRVVLDHFSTTIRNGQRLSILFAILFFSFSMSETLWNLNSLYFAIVALVWGVLHISFAHIWWIRMKRLTVDSQ